MPLSPRSKPAPEHPRLSLPSKIVYAAAPKGWDVRRTDANGTITFTWEDRDGYSHLVEQDAQSLRNEFLAAKTPDDAFAFLQKCGPFRNTGSVTWTTFVKWQEFFARQWSMERGFGVPPELGDPEETARVSGEPSLRIYAVKQKSGKSQNTLLLHCDSAVEAIAGAIFLDKAGSDTPRLAIKCGTCETLFVPKTKRTRYCKPICSTAGWRADKASQA